MKKAWVHGNGLELVFGRFTTKEPEKKVFAENRTKRYIREKLLNAAKMATRRQLCQLGVIYERTLPPNRAFITFRVGTLADFLAVTL